MWLKQVFLVCILECLGAERMRKDTQSCIKKCTDFGEEVQSFRCVLVPLRVESERSHWISIVWPLTMSSVALKGMLCMLSCFNQVQLFVTPWTIAHQALLSMEFSRQEYWSGLPCPPPGDLPDPGMEPKSLLSPALASVFFTTNATWEASLKRINESLSEV